MKKITLFLLLLLLTSISGYSQFTPAVEGFEDTTGPATPPAWELGTGTWAVFDNGVGLAQSWTVNSTAGLVYQGVNSAYINRENIGAGNTSEDYLASPLVTVPANGKLHFFSRTFTSGNQGTLYRVMIAPANDPANQTNPFAYTQVQEWTESTIANPFNVYQEQIVDLNGYVGQDVYIAFVMVFTQPGTTLGDRWLLDNVSIAEQCDAPTLLSAGSITQTSATLSWTGTAPQYEIEIIPQSGTFTGTGTVVSGISGINTFNATQTTAGTAFTPTTAYSFRVRAICSGGVNSAWSPATGGTNFSTSSPGLSCSAPISITSLIYTTTDNTSAYADSTDTPQPAACAGGATNYMAGNDVFYSYIAPANGTISVTMTPTAANSSLFVYDGCANVGVSCVGGVADATTGVRSLPNIPVVAGHEYIIVISSSGATQTVGYTLVVQPVACAQPTALAAGSVTQTSANLSWAAGAATSWEYVYQLAGGTVPTGSGTTTSSNTVNAVTPLTPNTQYEFYVRADCNDGSGNFSAWTGPFAFRTLCDAFPVTFQEGFNSTSTSEACWTVVNANNDADSWDMNYNVTPFEGDQVAMLYTDFNAGANDDWLISPQVILNGNQRLRYRYKVQSANEPNDFRVMLSTNGNGTADFTTTLVPLASYTNTTYQQNIVNLSAYSGPVNIAFHVPPGGADGWRLYIDNFIIENLPTCPEPTALTLGTVLATTANLSWTAGNTETQWDVLALPCNSPTPAPEATPTDTTTNNTNYQLTTTPTTCYDVYVRAVCSGSDSSPWVGPVTFTTQVAPPVCGGLYTDPAGSSADYDNNVDSTVTICPPVGSTDVVTVTFTSFDTEATWDGIYVFDGNTISAPQIASTNGTGNGPLAALAGAYWGTTIPGPFTSSSADGCLTFRFRSDASGVRAGWVANVTCAPPPPCRKPAGLAADTASITFHSVVLNWAQPVNPDGSTATAWEYLALPCNSPAPTATSVATGPAGTNLQFLVDNLNSAACYDIYVRAVCSDTESSAWAGPATITTQVAPPICGGNFVDAAGPSANYANSSDSTVTICPQNPGDVVTVTFTSFFTEATWDGLYVFDGNTINAPQLASNNPAGNVPGGLAGSYWGQLTGANLPGPFTSSSPDGCLTFRFRSDTSVNDPGWVANITCSPAPPCAKPNALGANFITATSAVLTWNEPNANVNQWEVFIVDLGSAAPLPTDTGIIVSTNQALFSGLIPGHQYTFYVRGLCPTSGTSAWSAGFNFNTLIINDECDGALFAPVNSSAVCQQIVSGTLTGATPTISPAIAAPCQGVADDDVWFQFVATNPYLNVSLQSIVGTTQNLNFAAYSGQCGGTLAPIFCSAANAVSGVLNGLNIGETYYIRVWSNAGTAQTVNFNMCISTPSTCPTASTVCSLADYANTTGVANLGTIGCLFTSPNPAYFTIQVNSTGPINFTLTQSTQQSTNGVPGPANIDVDYAAWGPFTTQDEACAFIGSTTPFAAPGIGVPVTQQTGCSYSAAPTETLNIANAVAGQLYVILITNFSNQPGYITLNQNNTGDTGHGTTLCCPDAYFTYNPVSYCKSPTTPNPLPVISPNSVAGIFSSTIVPGLVFVDSGTNTGSLTGEVDLMASAPGNYVITNTVAATDTCDEKVKNFTINITEPTTATIAYDAPLYCKSITTLQNVIFTGTTGGSYSASPNGGLYIDVATGAINPSLSSPGIYTVTYSLPGSGVCVGSNPTTQVEIAPLPNIIQPDPVEACNSYTLPALAVGNYFDGPGGTGNQLAAGDVINTVGPHVIYIYAVSAAGCINEKSFTVTINTVPTPVVTVTQPTCASPTGTIVVTSPVSAGGTLPTDLFISEVTDEDVGSLTYVEIYNGTGAPVNLNNYKLKVYNNGSSTASCNNQLAGTLANNSTWVVAVGTTTNQGGVVPNQVFAGCGGVNFDDNIRLTSSTDVAIDLWGRTDGVAFTPSNQPGYTYRRLASAPHPSMTWNPADWTALDPQDYTNVGSYTYLTSNYEYGLDANYQAGTTFNNVTPGDHTVTVHDLVTGCYSDPITVTMDVIGQLPAETTFTYTESVVCKLSGTVLTPDTSATGFTTGGTYTATPAGLDINATTGVITSATSDPGQYVVTYAVAFDPATCRAADSHTVNIEITNSIPAVVGITYTTPNCRIAQPNTIAPTFAANHTAGGTFSATPAGLNIDATTGVITLVSSTQGAYTVSYHVADDLANCIGDNTGTFSVVINDPTDAVVGISYTTPNCKIAQPNTISPTFAANYTVGGAFSATPAGLSIDAATGVITLGSSNAGSYTVSYHANDDTVNCIAAKTGTFVVVINDPTQPEVGFNYTTPICPSDTTLSPSFNAGFVTGGTFSSPTLTVDSNTGVVTLTAGTAPATYDVTYSVTANTATCQTANSHTAQIEVSAPVTITADGDCQGMYFVLTVSPAAGTFDPSTTFSWSNSAGPVGTTQSVNALTADTYDVTVTTNGCSSTQHIVVTAADLACVIQKGISANGDGLNDAFDLSGFNVKKITIYNRYGMEVYSKTDYTNQWKGESDKGDELPDGTYYYVFVRTNGETRTGWIYINRQQ